MRLLADTANIKELEILKNKNLIEGVTTNPSIISKEGKYSLQGTTQGRYLTGGVPPVRFSM